MQVILIAERDKSDHLACSGLKQNFPLQATVHAPFNSSVSYLSICIKIKSASQEVTRRA